MTMPFCSYFYPVFSGYLFDIIDREGIILGTSVVANGICNCIIPFSKNVKQSPTTLMCQNKII